MAWEQVGVATLISVGIMGVLVDRLAARIHARHYKRTLEHWRAFAADELLARIETGKLWAEQDFENWVIGGPVTGVPPGAPSALLRAYRKRSDELLNAHVLPPIRVDRRVHNGARR